MAGGSAGDGRGWLRTDGAATQVGQPLAARWRTVGGVQQQHATAGPWGRSPSLPVRLAVSWLTNALLLGLVAAVLADVHVDDGWSLLAAAAVFGVLNTVLKPLLRFVTLPLAILTLGIAWFFVSMLMLVITEELVGGFDIHGFWTLVGATLIVWLANLVLDITPGPWQVTGRRRRLRRSRERT
jgi:putative membrane protein